MEKHFGEWVKKENNRPIQDQWDWKDKVLSELRSLGLHAYYYEQPFPPWNAVFGIEWMSRERVYRIEMPIDRVLDLYESRSLRRYVVFHLQRLANRCLPDCLQ